MTEEKKKELFPFFAYLYSQQLNPEKYGATSSIEEWSQLLKENEEDINAIVQSAENLSDEEWANIEKQYSATQASDSAEQTMYAKKGAKLKKLSAMKSKKCKCGCAMITSKEEGGKLSMKCSCGCSMKKKEEGGKIEDKKEVNPKLAKLQKLKKYKKGGEVDNARKKPSALEAINVERNKKLATPTMLPEVVVTAPMKTPVNFVNTGLPTQAEKRNAARNSYDSWAVTGTERGVDAHNAAIAPVVAAQTPVTLVQPTSRADKREQAKNSYNRVDRGRTISEVELAQANTPVVAEVATAAPVAPAAPVYDTNTLWGWMKSTGYGDASFGGRRDLWNKFYGLGTTSAQGYTGTANQNARLLDALKKANAMGFSIEKAANLANLTLLKAPSIKVNVPKKPDVYKP